MNPVRDKKNNKKTGKISNGVNLDRALESKINRKIIKFFLENPSSIDTSRGIATWINENIDKTEKGLRELAKVKILVPHGTGAAIAYGYTTNTHLASRIKTSLKKYKPR
jgi:flagellar basal body P-ring protein FlgI